MSAWSELKGFVTNKFSVSKIGEFVFERVENIVLVISLSPTPTIFIPLQNECFRGVYWD